MSLVGPRPEVPRYVELYTPEQREILRLKPGITDLASLLFRDEESLLRGTQDVEKFYIQNCLPKKLELNRQYATRASLVQDVRIILLTIGSLIRGTFCKAHNADPAPPIVVAADVRRLTNSSARKIEPPYVGCYDDNEGSK